MFNLSEEVRDALKKAGWDESIRAETLDIEHHLTATGQPISAVVMTFIEWFAASKIQEMEVNPVEVYRQLGGETQVFYQKWVGKPLCMVGFLSQSALFLTQEGAVYSAFSGYVHHWGDTVEEALLNIWVRRNFTRVPSRINHD